MMTEKKKKYQQEWRERNKEKIRSYTKTHNEKYAEEIKKKRKTPEYRLMMLKCVKKWRLENKDRFLRTEKEKKKRNRKKINARFRITNAIRRGKMKRGEVCSKCGVLGKMEAHHWDYSKPLEVQWVCRLCHEAIHHVE